MTNIRTEDKHIGKRIKLRRQTTGVTQSGLAEALGLSFQQIQKYETGKNRISSSRLVDIAKALGVKPAWFFRGLNGESTPENEVTCRDEVLLLESYRTASTNAKTSILRIAQEAAQVCA